MKNQGQKANAKAPSKRIRMHLHAAKFSTKILRFIMYQYIIKPMEQVVTILGFTNKTSKGWMPI